MERVFLNTHFPKWTVIPVHNGSSWNTEKMCEQIATKYRSRKIFPEEIIVWFDRESNPDEPIVIADRVRDYLETAGFPRAKVHCLISDRMVENIILADQEMIRVEFAMEDYVYPGDGVHGKSIIKALYRDRSDGYKETTHGPQLLGKTRLSRGRVCSDSIHGFLNIHLPMQIHIARFAEVR